MLVTEHACHPHCEAPKIYIDTYDENALRLTYISSAHVTEVLT